MQNRSTNPVASLIGFLVPVGFIIYFLSKTGVVSGASLFLWAVIILAGILVVGGLRIIDQYDRGVI